MQRNIFPLRWVLSILLLAGLFFGAAGQSLARVEAASEYQQTCSNPIAEWDFNNSNLEPSPGTSGIMVAGPGIVGPVFEDGRPKTNKIVVFSGWDPKEINPTDYLEFQVDTTGHDAIVFSFSAMSSEVGPRRFLLSYSVDGGAHFTNYKTEQIGTRGNIFSYDFSAIKGFDNNPNVRFRLSAYLASQVDAPAEWFLDDISVIGACESYFTTLTPSPTATLNASMTVIISEVAWMGTLDSSSDEWIELYNPTSNRVYVDGWMIKLKGGTDEVVLSGYIEPDGYYLLERNADAVNDDLPSDSKGIFSFSLSNDGATLELYDNNSPTRNLVDTANANGGKWPAGASSTTCTFGSMERVGYVADLDANWVTNVASYTWASADNGDNPVHGTPGRRNWIFKSPFDASKTPPPSTAVPAKSIVISEVAWAGTTADSIDEWIELQNPSSVNTVDLTGWSLRADDGTPTIALMGAIDKNSFYLITHKDSNAVNLNQNGNPLTNFVYEPGCNTGSLNNNGEILRLYDPANTVVDTANKNGESWPAGSASGFRSMERRGPNYDDSNTSWITNTGVVKNGYDKSGGSINGTPKRANWAWTVTPTPLVRYTPTRTPTPLPQPSPVLVINEFLARSGTDWNNDGRVDVYDEYIEVVNAGTVNVSLSGYKLDDYELDATGKVISNAFTLPSGTLKPGEKAVFYGSQTGIRLDDSGDTVRLLSSSNVILDAFTYRPVKSLDVSTCRYTDGYGSWIPRCFPTPGLPNALIGDGGAASGDIPASVCVLPDSAPDEFVAAECEESGLGIWNHSYWDSFPGEGDPIWRSDEWDKWLVIYQ